MAGPRIDLASPFSSLRLTPLKTEKLASSLNGSAASAANDRKNQTATIRTRRKDISPMFRRSFVLQAAVARIRLLVRQAQQWRILTRRISHSLGKGIFGHLHRCAGRRSATTSCDARAGHLHRNLSKAYGKRRGRARSFPAIERGSIFGFLGANGAGKTTTIRMLCGLVRPSSGHATIAGYDVWKDRQTVRTKFGYVAQRFSLYRDLTVRENLRFFAGACRRSARKIEARIKRLLSLDRPGSEARCRRPARYPAACGNCSRIACALVHEPPLLFLDEPTSGLDPVHRQQMWNLLYDLSNSGITIFITTHYMDEAERCTDVGFHRSRPPARESAAARISSRASTPSCSRSNVEPVMPALVRLRDEPDVLGVSLRSGSLRIYAAEPEELVRRWREQWPFADLQWKGNAGSNRTWKMFSPPTRKVTTRC